MRRVYQAPGWAPVFAFAFILTTPAWAQTGTTAPMSSMGQLTTPPRETEMNLEPTERRELREERLTLREEHESLDAERDRLQVQCMDAKGQDRSDCEDKQRILQEKRAALHKRLKVLHQKVEAAEKQRAAAAAAQSQPVGIAAPAHE